MVVDSIPIPHVPSSQPTDDEQVVYAPPSQARADGEQAPVQRIPPAAIAPIVAELNKWSQATADTFSCLSLDELNNLSDIGLAKAFDLGVNVQTLISTLINV